MNDAINAEIIQDAETKEFNVFEEINILKQQINGLGAIINNLSNDMSIIHTTNIKNEINKIHQKYRFLPMSTIATIMADYFNGTFISKPIENEEKKE